MIARRSKVSEESYGPERRHRNCEIIPTDIFDYLEARYYQWAKQEKGREGEESLVIIDKLSSKGTTPRRLYFELGPAMNRRRFIAARGGIVGIKVNSAPRYIDTDSVELPIRGIGKKSPTSLKDFLEGFLDNEIEGAREFMARQNGAYRVLKERAERALSPIKTDVDHEKGALLRCRLIKPYEYEVVKRKDGSEDFDATSANEDRMSKIFLIDLDNLLVRPIITWFLRPQSFYDE